jgi:hypothetical protein
LGITAASFSAWVFDSSRWYGVGWTLSSGSAASATQWPPNGSRYVASTLPPASSICLRTRDTSGDGDPVAHSSEVSPIEPASTLTFFLRGVAGFFFAADFSAFSAFGAAFGGMRGL